MPGIDTSCGALAAASVIMPRHHERHGQPQPKHGQPQPSAKQPANHVALIKQPDSALTSAVMQFRSIKPKMITTTATTKTAKTITIAFMVWI